MYMCCSLCRAQLESLQAQLQEEAEARNKMEEEMKRSFMRGMFVKDCMSDMSGHCIRGASKAAQLPPENAEEATEPSF
jgi:hypothetical protein